MALNILTENLTFFNTILIIIVITLILERIRKNKQFLQLKKKIYKFKQQERREKQEKQEKERNQRRTEENKVIIKDEEIIFPNWYQNLLDTKKDLFLNVLEWEHTHRYHYNHQDIHQDTHQSNHQSSHHNSHLYRKENGWLGEDYMHSKSSPVEIFNYILLQHNETNEIQLESIVYFKSRSESHQGLCHGGTMCAVMDDIIGWVGFCESGSCIPWSGYTVQINTSLKKAIPINSILKVEGWIERREGNRKIHIKARLINEEKEEHAVATGLFLKK